MKKLLIISGPTASGKTSLGFQLAKKFNGEIVSADSRQVYKGMDIVTGKDLDKEIKTWMIDVVSPDVRYNVSDFYYSAWIIIKDIWKREKLPIVVGGTGFYIRALLDGVGTMSIKPDFALRKKLDTLSVKELADKLQKLNPQKWDAMNSSDRNNPRRLVRAIEIAQKIQSDSGQARMTSFWGGMTTTTPESSILWIGLTADFETLYKRIDERVNERVKMGAVEETKQLAKKYGWNVYSMTGQGYRELRDFVEKKISLEKAVLSWKFSEHMYARKQKTWFKKEKRIKEIAITNGAFRSTVERTVEDWCMLQ